MTVTANPRAFADAERASKDFVCADCGGVLVVRNAGGDWLAMCATHSLEHTGFKSRTELEKEQMRERLERDPRLSQALAVQGAHVPLPTRTIAEMDKTTLMRRVETGLRFAGILGATVQQRQHLLFFATRYGLDPMTDVTLYEGKPWVTIEGWYRKLREHPQYRGHSHAALTRDEKEAWGWEPEDIVVRCDIRTASRGVISDYGVVRSDEVAAARAKSASSGKRSAPVGVHPQALALKRATARAARAAVGLDIPDGDDAAAVIDAEAYVVGDERPAIAAAPGPSAPPPAQRAEPEPAPEPPAASAAMDLVNKVRDADWQAYVTESQAATNLDIPHEDLRLPVDREEVRAETARLREAIARKKLDLADPPLPADAESLDVQSLPF